MNRPLTASRSRGSKPAGSAVPFHCLLDERCLELLPQPALARLKLTKFTGDLVLNPYSYLGSAQLRTLPFAVTFPEPDNITWVLDDDRNALQPFWLPQDLRVRVANMQAGKSVTSELLPREAKLLRFAGVLVNEKECERRSHDFARSQARAATFFQKNRYVALNDLLHPLHIATLRRYIRQLAASGRLVKGKGGYQHCFLSHNEPVARFFHHQLTTVVSEVIGEQVQPSFAFTLSYHGGSELSRHTDREQCEFTLSLCLDFIPEPKGVTKWPLHMETGDGQVTVEQSLGDALLFCGRDLAHYRERLADGCTSTSILFHFVRRNFDGELD